MTPLTVERAIGPFSVRLIFRFIKSSTSALSPRALTVRLLHGSLSRRRTENFIGAYEVVSAVDVNDLF